MQGINQDPRRAHARRQVACLSPLGRGYARDRDEIRQATTSAIVEARPGLQRLRELALKHQGGARRALPEWNRSGVRSRANTEDAP